MAAAVAALAAAAGATEALWAAFEAVAEAEALENYGIGKRRPRRHRLQAALAATVAKGSEARWELAARA